jgi:tripartite-type tricarboxylate transporter receptor subunit TctC
MMRATRILLSGLALAFAATGTAHAADFPSKPMRIVVPYPPGGSTDALARVAAQKISERLGQPVVVENRPGASEAIAAAYVGKGVPADGHTLFLGTSTALAVNPSLYKRLSYDPKTDLVPIILAVKVPSVVVVNAALPVQSMKELNDYLKTRGREANYASAGNGTPAHLGAELYKRMAGVASNHVPYKGGAPALADLTGGQTTYMIAVLSEAMPLAKAGKLRALAITTATRMPNYPNLPTVAESGVPGYELSGWYGFLAPAGTPKEIVTRLNEVFDAVIKDPEVQAKLSDAGFDFKGGPPSALSELMASETEKWRKVIVDANITVD